MVKKKGEFSDTLRVLKQSKAKIQSLSFVQWVGRFVHARPLWTAFLIGFAYFGYVISWMFALRTAEIATGLATKIVAITAAIIMVTTFALGYVFFVWLVRRLKLSVYDKTWWQIPFVWVIAECFRAVLFSVIALGPGGRVGSFWTFGNAGYWLVYTPLVYIGRFGGLYLLSLLVTFLVVSCIRSLRSKNWREPLSIVSAAAILAFLGWALYAQPQGEKRTIAAVQFANEFSPEAFSLTTADLLGRLPEKSVDAIILPEYSHLWEGDSVRDTEAASRVLKNPDGVLIDSVQERSTMLGHNLVTYHRPDGSVAFDQKKWFSVPGGEYVPYIYQVVLAYAGQEQLLLHFQDQKSVEHGDTPEMPYEFDGAKYGGLACSGAFVPELYRGMAQRGATILSNSASLDTMGISDLYHIEARQMARLHAVANARPFVQAARGGYSYIIDSNGTFVDGVQQRGYALVHGDVTTNDTLTLYTLFGDWIVWGGIVIIGITGLTNRKKQPYTKPKH